VVLTSVYVPANALRISCSVHRFSTPLTASGDAIANDAHGAYCRNGVAGTDRVVRFLDLTFRRHPVLVPLPRIFQELRLPERPALRGVV
jgi:hypothetical protein